MDGFPEPPDHKSTAWAVLHMNIEKQKYKDTWDASLFQYCILILTPFFSTRGERIVFLRPNTNTNNIRNFFATEYEYEYYS